MEEGKKLSAKDFLGQQRSVENAFLATVETGATEDRVKVTPWREEAGCLCSLAFELPLSAISSVTPTKHQHACCGKKLTIVEVEFANSHHAAADIVSQQVTASGTRQEHSHSRSSQRWLEAHRYAGQRDAGYVARPAAEGCYSTCLKYTRDPVHCRNYCYGPSFDAKRDRTRARAAIKPDIGPLCSECTELYEELAEACASVPGPARAACYAGAMAASLGCFALCVEE
jgi:hypothetical protein